MKRNYHFLNGLNLRIIAMVLMVIDHIAVLIFEFHLPINVNLYFFMRIIGRMALPIFAFLAVEGARYTHNIKKYLLRLGTMIVIMGIINSVIEYGFNVLHPPHNIFIDLFAGVTLVYFLMHPSKKNWWMLLPTIYALTINILNTTLKMSYPAALKPDYGWYATALFLGYFLAYRLARAYIQKSTGITTWSEGELAHNYSFHLLYVILASVFLLWVNLIWYILDVTWPIWTKTLGLQSYAILAGCLLLLYNGQEGYKSRWLQLGYYAFYPLSLGVTALILYLISIA